MNQNDKVEQSSSDYDPSDTATNSLNNSLSEEEFSAGTSNRDSDAVELTISCHHRSCENEVDYSSSTNLNKQTEEEMSEADINNVDKQCCSGDGEENAEQVGVSNHSMSDTERSQNNPSSTVQKGDSPDQDVTVQAQSEICKVTSSCPSEIPLASQFLEKAPINSQEVMSDACKTAEHVKPLKRLKQASSNSIAGHDMHDPLLRLDNLPNVSPDSGIISLDESPFGNESPSSHGEPSSEPQPVTQLPCARVSDDVSNMYELMSSDNTSVDVTDKKLCEIEEKDMAPQEKLNTPGEHKGADESVTSSDLTESVPNSERTNVEADVDKFTSLKKHAVMDKSKSEGTNYTLVDEAPHSPFPSNGNSVILSSPHKITQAMGRKKRGRPPKKKKTLLLKHKKSTLYSGLYGILGASDNTEAKDSTTDSDIGKGSINNNSEISGAIQISDHAITNVHGKPENGGNNCDNLVVKKRSPGRPKGSLSKKKLASPIIQRTIRSKQQNLRAMTSNNVACKEGEKSLSTRHQPTGEKPKRPRGRPRKNPLPTDSTDKKPTSAAPTDCSTNASVRQSAVVSNTVKPRIGKAGKRKFGRKRFFTQRKRKTTENPRTGNQEWRRKKISVANGNPSVQPSITTSESRISSKTNNIGKLVKAKKEGGFAKTKAPSCPEKSVFQDNDLDALLKSVKSSISSQFTNEDASSDILSFDNPFKVAQPPPFPKMMRPTSPNIVKPKAKKPKLHVMMRRTKRKKRKKIQNNNKPVTSSTAVPPKKFNLFASVSPQKRLGKFTVSPQKKIGTFGSAVPEKRLSFFTSRVQPSKILASSRLNVFRSGTGVDGPHRSGTPTDIDQPDYSDKRCKKRHRLLYRKSKHKNIIDPVFAADLDILVSGIGDLAVAENPSDNFIRVRPGEVPLPSIFRVIRIDVNKKVKDRIFAPEVLGLDKAKPLKPRKDTPSPHEAISSVFKPISKVGRKKSLSDQSLEQREHSSVSDSNDQCLPPKKRHRMVNMEAPTPVNLAPNNAGETAMSRKEIKPLSVKRKGRRPRKAPGIEETKPDESGIPGRLGQQFVGQELTIDTSSYTTGGSSACTPSISPCTSRFSTRSSTLPSLSSPSPTGSTGFRSRHHSKNSYTLACPIHSLSSCAIDRSSCAECHLLEQSISPGGPRSVRTTLRSLSVQASESSYSSERPASSAESSPVSTQPDRLLGRSARKRRKSSNFSANDSDSSPPRLEKNASLSPNAYHDNSVFSEPPEITCSPFKTYVSPRRHTAAKLNHHIEDIDISPASPSPRKKLCSNVTVQRNLRQPLSPNKSVPSTFPSKNLCNKSSSCSQSSSKSVIQTSYSEYEPLPLEHCSKRILVEEIKAAMSYESDDGSSSVDENQDDYETSVHPSLSSTSLHSQPPRKRFQRVGLFSDFYKDEEPRKRCENMVRCRDKLVYVKEEHEFGLMPQPLHIGQLYMRQVQNFQLPYDIWWQHIHQQLPKKPEPKIKFRTIRSNVYSDSKVSTRKLEVPRCNCTPQHSGGKGCGDDCLNRMIYTECSPSTCPFGENCGNQKIQKHEWAPGLEKFQTKDRGYGVRTRHAIKNGNLILEYLGEVVSETEFRRRMMEEYSDECHHYALHLDSGSLIDGYRMGNIGRYVNHSCQPNCEMQKWNVNGLYRMVLFALRDIEAGEELSYDYNFDSFNQETQQECRCGSTECRGVIGVKTQRSSSTCKLPEKVVDDGKDKRKSKLLNKKMKEKPSDPVPVQPLAKPMTFKERCYARKHRTFLVRNVDKVRNQRNPAQDFATLTKEELNVLDYNKINAQNSDLMLAHLNERSVKTRLAAYTKDNPELARRHQLAQICDKMLTELLSLKDENDCSLVAPLMSLPSRKKQPQYYQVVREPIDMSMIKQRVKTGFYDHLSSFNADLMLLFNNVELYCGPKSDMGQVILKLRRVLNCVKTDVASQIDELLGAGTTKAFMDSELERLEQACCKGNNEPEEDIIRCICGVTRDEGLMLQCEKCLRWQHCDCVQASGKEEHYLCDRCEPRYYDPEILLIPSPPDAMPDCTHYMTLLKDDVQYAVGDCVYVMRDCKRTSTGTPLRSSHRLMATVNPDKLDIFRLEQLWKDPKGERFASGTPYLRPQETFHEPTRKFYHNELFRTPNFEIIPMDLVMGKCVVMDPTTYVKGRPKGVKEQDVYICEYRVDKTAHLFHKIQKIWYPINTGRFCFDWFDTKLNIRRTYSPHEVPEEYKRKAERNMAAAPVAKSEVKQEEKFDVKKAKVITNRNNNVMQGKVKVDESIKNDMKLKAEVKVNVKKGNMQKKDVDTSHPSENKIGVHRINDNKKKEKRLRLDRILTKLLNNLPGKQKVDLTYLLDDGKRVRKKVVK